MASHFFELLRLYFREYGYWTIAIVLLLENAGIPVPGETVLLFAGFLAFSEHHLQLQYIILLGIVAATLGDNLGYYLGARGGRPLLMRYRKLFRIRQSTLEKGEELFRSHGAVTVFFARFIFGMRIIAGPLAGTLRMPWKTFVLFNFLGAAVWVTVIAGAGFAFGTQWERLLLILDRINVIAVIAAALLALFFWMRYRMRKAGKD
jgi:membrane protein DedA with SNARE-associated domain